MRLHALRLAAPTCATLSCAADLPLLQRAPVYDDAGVAYAFDLEVTQGAALLLVATVLTRALVRRLAAWVKEREGSNLP